MRRLNPLRWIKTAVGKEHNNQVFLYGFLIPFCITGYFFFFHPQYGVGSGPELTATIKQINIAEAPFKEHPIMLEYYEKMPLETTTQIAISRRNLWEWFCFFMGWLFSRIFWWSMPIFCLIAFRDEIKTAWEEHKKRKAKGEESSFVHGLFMHAVYDRIPGIGKK